MRLHANFVISIYHTTHIYILYKIHRVMFNLEEYETLLVYSRRYIVRRVFSDPNPVKKSREGKEVDRER